MGRCECGKFLMPYAVEVDGVRGMAWLCPSKLPAKMIAEGGVDIGLGRMRMLSYSETRGPDASIKSEPTVINFVRNSDAGR